MHNCTTQKIWYNNQRGYITLISVLIIGVIGTSITMSLLLLGLGASRTSFAFEQSRQANALAHTCAEEALQQIRDVTSYTGTGTVTLGEGVCGFEVTSQGAENRTITATGTVGTITRKVKIIIDSITPTIQVVSWQEVGSF